MQVIVLPVALGAAEHRQGLVHGSVRESSVERCAESPSQEFT
jgi:hypothetical protein